MAAVTYLWGATLAVKKEATGDKEGKAEERGKKVEDMYKASCHTSGNTNNKNTYLYHSVCKMRFFHTS